MTSNLPQNISHNIPHNILSLVLAQYGYSQEQCKISLLGNGLINHTYLVKSHDKTFVLQCLNQQVFTAPERVTDNVDLISEHLLSQFSNKTYALMPIWQLRDQNNKNHVNVQGQYWRALHYIEDCYTLESITTPEQASFVGNAFAQFTNAFDNFNSQKLAEIIPQFHHLPTRIAQLDRAIKTSKNSLLLKAKSNIEFIKSQKNFIDEVSAITKNLPLRVTHNDTKINNLLFSNKTNKPIAVVDLDTCMAGYLMHDFGDMVRSCCASIAEDSAELDKMSINIDILTALTKAYIAGFNGALAKIEINSLLLGIKLMPLMLGIRFLTDFLNGDQYFKTGYATHNLVRANNQLHLYKLLCQHESLLANIVLSTSRTTA
jgi:Ser/Thr protein kinase RdoA (MazF antagonist)